MTNSQNGLPLLESRTKGDLPRLRVWVIPDTGRHLLLRDGSVGFLLALLALIYHETVQALNIKGDLWDEWGYAPRPIRGSSTPSNHGSGSACDLNATRHPLGRRGTYTKAQRARIVWVVRVIFRGTIRAGECYRGRIDGMHFETVGPFRRLERNARRLTHTKRGRRILAANPGAREVIYL